MGGPWPRFDRADRVRPRSEMTAAFLDRLRHRAQSVFIEGRSYRIRDQSDA